MTRSFLTSDYILQCLFISLKCNVGYLHFLTPGPALEKTSFVSFRKQKLYCSIAERSLWPSPLFKTFGDSLPEFTSRRAHSSVKSKTLWRRSTGETFLGGNQDQNLDIRTNLWWVVIISRLLVQFWWEFKWCKLIKWSRLGQCSLNRRTIHN